MLPEADAAGLSPPTEPLFSLLPAAKPAMVPFDRLLRRAWGFCASFWAVRDVPVYPPPPPAPPPPEDFTAAPAGAVASSPLPPAAAPPGEFIAIIRSAVRGLLHYSSVSALAVDILLRQPARPPLCQLRRAPFLPGANAAAAANFKLLSCRCCCCCCCCHRPWIRLFVYIIV
uniref:Uncharacterized protein n=1 Tax=Odontella aurita TaxID=265563 RepID=A0A7S4JUJ3_9STRA